MKLYIAGPMSGLPEYNYPAFFAAEQTLAAAGYNVLNPARNEPSKGNQESDGYASWSWYMRRSLEQIAKADGMALLPGWRSSEGAQLEVHIAHKLGMRARPLWEWLPESKGQAPAISAADFGMPDTTDTEPAVDTTAGEVIEEQA